MPKFALPLKAAYKGQCSMACYWRIDFTLCTLWHATSAENISQTAKGLEVLIIGAGIACVTLVILLKKTNVPYEVYERAVEVKPIESALHLGVSVAPIFSQVVYNKFVDSTKPCTSNGIFDENLTLSFVINVKESEEM
ncbi:hypothetical protein EDD21DRAFT_421844 [Dissophora ornata]|nr:hypothetical protein EDD21DRAFT_421844 [Dissophora ornata]